MIKYNSKFKVSKVYTIGLQKYRGQKIRVCGKSNKATRQEKRN